MDKEQLRRLHRVHRPENFRPRASTWYEIRNVSTDVAVVNLYDEIGLWGITASSFIDDLHAVNAKRIELHVSSPGGDVWDGLAIMNSLAQHPAQVDVIVDGLAASAASFIAMAGDTVKMSPGAMLMIHDASGVVVGNEQDMREMADLLDKASQNIANLYARRAGGTPEDWRTAMRAETWYTDQEAVDAGLADGIVGSEALNNDNASQVVMSATHTDDNVVTTPDTPENELQEPEAFDFAAFRAAMTAVKEATRG